MKYPRMPEALDKRKKLMKEDIKAIKSLYKSGRSRKWLAKKFNVSVPTIKYHFYSKEYRILRNKKFAEKARMIKESYKKRRRIIDKRSKKYKREVVPEMKIWAKLHQEKCNKK